MDVLWQELGSLRAYVDENDIDNTEAMELMITVRDKLNILIDTTSKLVEKEAGIL